MYAREGPFSITTVYRYHRLALKPAGVSPYRITHTQTQTRYAHKLQHPHSCGSQQSPSSPDTTHTAGKHVKLSSRYIDRPTSKPRISNLNHQHHHPPQASLRGHTLSTNLVGTRKRTKRRWAWVVPNHSHATPVARGTLQLSRACSALPQSLSASCRLSEKKTGRAEVKYSSFDLSIDFAGAPKRSGTSRGSLLPVVEIRCFLVRNG